MIDHGQQMENSAIICDGEPISNLIKAIGNCIISTLSKQQQNLRSDCNNFDLGIFQERKIVAKVDVPPNLLCVYMIAKDGNTKVMARFDTMEYLILLAESIEERYLDMFASDESTLSFTRKFLLNIGQSSKSDTELYNSIDNITDFLKVTNTTTCIFHNTLKEYNFTRLRVENLKRFIILNKKSLIEYAKLMVLNKTFSFNYTLFYQEKSKTKKTKCVNSH